MSKILQIVPALGGQRTRAAKILSALNTGLKRLAEAAGVDYDLSNYAARHSFSTKAIKNGVILTDIKDALGHVNIQTTTNYVASLKM